jgi:hypothetical protein
VVRIRTRRRDVFLAIPQGSGLAAAPRAKVRRSSSRVAPVGLGRNDCTFAVALSFPVGTGAVCPALGDVDGDKLPDTVVSHESSRFSVILATSK